MSKLHREDILDRKDEIQKYLDEHQSMMFIARKMNCQVSTLKVYFERMGLKWEPNQSRKGLKHLERRKTFLELSKRVVPNRRLLKQALLEEGIKEYKCEICGISKWLGQEITLQLHHVDGNSANNELSNLQLLCPNCHTQTDNYGSKKLAH